jgi:hypothetical protein
MLIQGDAQAQGDAVQGPVDSVVKAIISPGYGHFFVARQLINDAITQGYAHSKSVGISRQELSALGDDSLLGYSQVGCAKEPRPHAASLML